MRGNQEEGGRDEKKKRKKTEGVRKETVEVKDGDRKRGRKKK